MPWRQQKFDVSGSRPPTKLRREPPRTRQGVSRWAGAECAREPRRRPVIFPSVSLVLRDGGVSGTQVKRTRRRRYVGSACLSWPL